jgi:hypothetical protein
MHAQRVKTLCVCVCERESNSLRHRTSCSSVVNGSCHLHSGWELQTEHLLFLPSPRRRIMSSHESLIWHVSQTMMQHLTKPRRHYCRHYCSSWETHNQPGFTFEITKGLCETSWQSVIGLQRLKYILECFYPNLPTFDICISLWCHR